jgi:phosphohistidine phosphatase
MYLYLVQHGDSKSKEEDPERPLSEKGVAEVSKVASFLGRMKIPLENISHSGKARAAQTAKILMEHVDTKIRPLESDGLAPMDDPDIWAARLEGIEADTMLVGHLPHLGRLASVLLCGDPEAGVAAFRMGGVLCLGKQEGGWAVQWMVVPDMIKG